MNPILDLDLVQTPNPDDLRCIVFLRSGHTVKLPISRREFHDLTRVLRNSSADSRFVVIDDCEINLDAIDSVEPVSRIHRQEG